MTQPFLDAPGLEAVAADWRALFLATPEANPFYGPDFLLPLLRHVGPRASMRAVVAHLAPGGQGPLLALCPLAPPSRLLPAPGLVSTFASPFIFDGVPLLRAGHEQEAWAALIAALAPQASLLRICDARLDLAAVTALERLARARGLALLVSDRRERPALRPDDADPPQRAAILKDLRRRERRLAEIGAVAFAGATSGEAAARGLEAFLALEQAGWKGRRGTALAMRPATLAFAREALAAGNDAPALRVDVLTLDGRVIAAAPNLAGPGRAAAFKSAFDETLARVSPGVILDARARAHLAASRWCDCLDAGTDPDHPIGEIWTQRITVGTLWLALRPEVSAAELAAIAARLACLRRWREAAKALVARLRPA